MPLQQSHLTANVCTQCGQCCHFEEWVSDGSASVQEDVLINGWVFDNDDGTQQTMPIVKSEFKNSIYLKCDHLVGMVCTNFDSDGTDLRPDPCRRYHCTDQNWVPDHYDVDIVKVIVDNVHGTNLMGE